MPALEMAPFLRSGSVGNGGSRLCVCDACSEKTKTSEALIKGGKSMTDRTNNSMDRAVQLVVSEFNVEVVSPLDVVVPHLDPERSAALIKSKNLTALKKAIKAVLDDWPDDEARLLVESIAEINVKRERRGAPSVWAKAGEVSKNFVDLEAGLPRLWTASEYVARPSREFLLTGLIAERSLTFLIGPSGSTKTLMAMDWGACVALGRDWSGRSSRAGRVLYIAAEGLDAERITAWEAANGAAIPENFRILDAPVNLFSGSDASMIESMIREHRFDLVIVDTLARTMVGGDEDKARDVNRIIWVFDSWRAAGASVVALHHTGHANQNRERGSSAIRAAADDLFVLKRNAQRIELRFEKRRDGALDTPIELEITSVAGTGGVVLTPSGGPIPQSGILTKNETQALFVLEQANELGLTYNDWFEGSELAKSSFDNSRKSLINKGRVKKSDLRQGARYVSERRPGSNGPR